MKKLLLIDGNSLLFRAYYATSMQGRIMSTTSGVVTNAVFGFASMLHKALEMIEPDAVLVAFDYGKKTFRHDLYSDYKGGRKATPEDLIPQFQLVRDYLDSMNIQRFEMENIEADDIIGTMSRRYRDYETNILSSDKDLLQCIDDTTSVWLMKKGLSDLEKMDEASLKEKFGLKPHQITDLKGLMGDASDNIPGIPGVGEKTALKLLEQYETVENIIQHSSELKGKLKEKVEENADLALLSKQLSTIKMDVPSILPIEDCYLNINYESLYKFYESLEMNSMMKKIQPFLTKKEENNKVDFVVVKKIPSEVLVDDAYFLCDYNFEHPMDASCLGVVISKNQTIYYQTIDDLKKDSDCLYWLKHHRKYTFEHKMNLHCFNKENIQMDGLVYDGQIAAFLCDSSLSSIEKMAEKYHVDASFNRTAIYGIATKPKVSEFDDVIVYYTKKMELLKNIVKETLPLINADYQSLFYDLEMPLTSILFKMEGYGICVDEEVLEEISKTTYEKMMLLTKKITSYTGDFNVNSPKQLGEVLFDRLGLKANKKRSTSIEVLEELQGSHPIIDDLIEYRKVAKLYSTYAEGLRKYVYPDHKIHTIFNQCITLTGRLSSSDPNLQNISIKDEESREIRKAFIPSKGHVLMSADYSQIELRMLAHMANEETLIESFKENIDIHTKTAMDIFNVSKEEVTSSLRREAKTVNFGIVYGISDYGLSQQLSISRYNAQQYIETYFSKYPNIKKYMDESVQFALENGYVKTLLNRRRYIEELSSKNFNIREFGKRVAMNAPIQGSAADLIKLAMVHIDKIMEEKKVKSRMILQVHDELIFDVLQEEVEIMREIVEHGMAEAMSLKVPLEAKSNVGASWYDCK